MFSPIERNKKKVFEGVQKKLEIIFFDPLKFLFITAKIKIHVCQISTKSVQRFRSYSHLKFGLNKPQNRVFAAGGLTD